MTAEILTPYVNLIVIVFAWLVIGGAIVERKRRPRRRK